MSSAFHTKNISDFLSSLGTVEADGAPLIRIGAADKSAIARRLIRIPRDQDEIRLRNDTAGVSRRNAATKARNQLI
ncbi:MAG TPA: hypothetical protein VIU14_00060 [Mesorhizobium sp.]